MKAIVLVILVIVAAALVEASPGLGGTRFNPPYINRIPPPKPRFRRSPDPEPQRFVSATVRGGNVGVQGSLPLPQGSLSAGWAKSFTGPERRPSYNFGYQHKIFENKHGSIGAMVGAVRSPGDHWQPYGGIGASFRFRRSDEPQEEVEE